jgi:hypothetical protein
MTVDDKNLQNSVQVIPDVQLGASDSIESGAFGTNSLVLQFAQNNKNFIPFGTAIRARDQQLKNFWKGEVFLASAITSISMTRASLAWELTGPPQSVNQVQQIFKKSDFGRGWQSLIAKVSLDLLQADNGAFIEIVRTKPRNGRKPESAPIVALNHLPSSMCVQSGNPETPVIYQDTNGELHELKWYQVIPLVEIPIPNEDNKNVQFCFVSRVLEMAETIRAVTNYQKEKVTGRFGAAIHVISGVKQHDIEVIERQAQQKATNQGLLNYMSPIILSTIDPSSQVTKQTIELAAFPDGFNYNELLTWYITLLALASGSDYMDFAPLPGKGLGTAAQSDSLAQKSRVKGILLFMKIIENALDMSKVLPPNVSFRYSNADATAESQQAEIKKTRAETRKFQIESGEITPEVAAQMAVDVGDLSQEYLLMMGQVQDQVITVADDERVSEHVLHPDDSTLIGQSSPKPRLNPQEDVKPMTSQKAASWIRRVIEEHPIQSASPIPASQLQTFQEHLRNWLTKETTFGTDEVWLDYILIKAAKHSGINPVALRHRMPDSYKIYVQSNRVTDSRGNLIYQTIERKETPKRVIADIVSKVTKDNYPEMVKEVYELANKPINKIEIQNHLNEAKKLGYFSEDLLKLKLVTLHTNLV